MKKPLTLCLALALCFGFASAYAATNPLVGTWKMTLSIGGGMVSDVTAYGDMYAVEYTFNADNTFVCTATQSGERGVVMEGTYRIDGNYVTITVGDGVTFTLGFTFGGPTLLLAGDDLEDGIFYVDYWDRVE